jgi:drug/metabolite transporter (DMT)-like permease
VKGHDQLQAGELTARPSARSVAIPFIIFTAIWGSTWIVIRGQLGTVPPQWSVTYRFIVAAIAMAAVAKWKGDNLNVGRKGLLAAAFLGFTQFCINFNAVYLAERHITSGVVATVFALLLIPATLLGWAMLGHKPSRRFAWSSLVAVTGIVLLFVHEINEHPANGRQIAAGIALTLVGMLGAATANVTQARPEIRRYPLFALLAWSMAAGAIIDGIIAFGMTGAPVFDPRPSYWLGVLYLALFASVLTFSLYYPVVRKIGPAKAAYSSVLVPIIAMGFSTALEHYRWTPTTIAGALLALGGMAAALGRDRSGIAAPDAA